MDMPLRGLCTSMTEPSAAVRTMLPLRVWVSRLPGGPGWPTKVREGTERAAATVCVGLTAATCRPLAELLPVLVAAAAVLAGVRRCAVGAGAGTVRAAVVAAVFCAGAAVRDWVGAGVAARVLVGAVLLAGAN